MEKILQIGTTFSFGKMYCSLFGHHYRVTKKITSHVKEYKCTRCHHEATIDDKGKITQLTPQLRDINETLLIFHEKKKHAC